MNQQLSVQMVRKVCQCGWSWLWWVSRSVVVEMFAHRITPFKLECLLWKTYVPYFLLLKNWVNFNALKYMALICTLLLQSIHKPLPLPRPKPFQMVPPDGSSNKIFQWLYNSPLNVPLMAPPTAWRTDISMGSRTTSWVAPSTAVQQPLHLVLLEPLQQPHKQLIQSPFHLALQWPLYLPIQ